MGAGPRGLMVLLLLVVFAASSFAAHGITPWPDNKKGAVSLTFDDGCMSHVSLGIPALNARGFKGTFFLITDPIGDWWPDWIYWINAANNGHEIASHTKTHPDLTTLSLSQVRDEMEGSKAAIDAHIISQKCLTFVYPFGTLNDSVALIANDIYIASRGIWCDLNSEPFDFSNVRACSRDANSEDIYAMADSAEQQGKWLGTFFPRPVWGGE